MGKSLIIKGADFSENGLPAISFVFPYDLENEVINSSLLSNGSAKNYGRYSVSKNLYDEYLSGKTVVGVKVYVHTVGTLSFYKQDPINQTAELFETLTFTETGWQTKRFANAIKFENSIYLSVLKKTGDAGDADTGKFGYQTDDPTSNVSNAKFAKACGSIETGSLSNDSDAIFGFCFECIDE